MLRLFTERALIARDWVQNALVTVDDHGVIASVDRDLPGCPAGATHVAGALVPGMPNVHSHAFQRAMAGLAERRGAGDDDFWSWRSTMYGFVERVTPSECQAIAEQLYVEMLKAGYTGVAEFHYLHHAPSGMPYEPPTEMSDRIVAAAMNTGIAVTLLPVLYTASGFGGQPPSPAQRRFVNDPERFAALLEALQGRYRRQPHVRLGVALHSLRAVTPAALRAALDAAHGLDATAPVHIHVAEQVREVEESLAWCGQRPVAWLLDHVDVDARWCLVHATHVNDAELEGIVASGAAVGLCPTTEANLGDGVFPAVALLRAGGCFGIGSDSNVSVSPREELRLLEYGQRLVHRGRALLADAPNASVGASLYHRALAGGAQALGRACGAVAPGYRADLVVLDVEEPTLVGRDGDALLDAFVFAGNDNPVSDVMVGGRWLVRGRRHLNEEEIGERFAAVQRRPPR